MKLIKLKRSRTLPDLSTPKKKNQFITLNVLFVLGGTSLILSFIYLILNLHQIDTHFIKVVPGLIFGLVMMAIFAIGIQHLSKPSTQEE